MVMKNVGETHGQTGITHLICFGNELHGDDGFGTVVYQHLSQCKLPRSVQIFNAGTAGLAALPLFENCQSVIMVDAMENCGFPGRLHRFTGSQLLQPSELPQTPFSQGEAVLLQEVSHGGGVLYLLRAVMATMESPPALTFWGAEVQTVNMFSPGLSESMMAAVDELVGILVRGEPWSRESN